MKLVLLNNIGNYGIILEPDGFILDTHLPVEFEQSGLLTIGEVTNRIVPGVNYIREINIAQGISKVTFVDDNGRHYNCGRIIRSGRHVSISHQIDGLVVALAKACDDQESEIKNLKEEFNRFKTQFGVSII